jgi:Protein of unknown function (DUF2442)
MCMWNENATVQSSGSIRWSWREATVSAGRNSWTSKGLLQKMNKCSGKRGMTTLVIDESSLRAVGAQLTEEALIVDLVDGRSVSVPLVWYPRLLRASMKERQQFRLIGSGEGIHWELLDEDISVEGIVAGRRSMESAESFRRWLENRRVRDEVEQ